ncbi:uncharacterized protein SCHCODRAFT_01136630 [Schizophyllum commune H4-8]|uniref:Uncharacterized protein n=1 Tax=Schizophyllum commune (strain H4-8 / FGSC 9210) TaxID=578458 RepID=D8QJG8_SCHCM|nr:uncharacterized protein SCHCODRAFT_01136630 [Schizophyllum commune H4-8]KAI5886334.1 hypothetical protein SCHCODRAFT_01136630 [Schizophyllum commune H4-8]
MPRNRINFSDPNAAEEFQCRRYARASMPMLCKSINVRETALMYPALPWLYRVLAADKRQISWTASTRPRDASQMHQCHALPDSLHDAEIGQPHAQRPASRPALIDATSINVNATQEHHADVEQEQQCACNKNINFPRARPMFQNSGSSMISRVSPLDQVDAPSIRTVISIFRAVKWQCSKGSSLVDRVLPGAFVLDIDVFSLDFDLLSLPSTVDLRPSIHDIDRQVHPKARGEVEDQVPRGSATIVFNTAAQCIYLA